MEVLVRFGSVWYISVGAGSWSELGNKANSIKWQLEHGMNLRISNWLILYVNITELLIKSFLISHEFKNLSHKFSQMRKNTPDTMVYILSYFLTINLWKKRPYGVEFVLVFSSTLLPAQVCRTLFGCTIRWVL